MTATGRRTGFRPGPTSAYTPAATSSTPVTRARIGEYSIGPAPAPFRSARHLDGDRQRLARQPLVTHGRLVDEVGHDHGRLDQVLGDGVVVDILVRVVQAGEIVERILDELEARDADVIERQVVRAFRVLQGDGRHSEVLQRLHPGLEDRPDLEVLLEIDAADAARAVVVVEISRDLGVVGLGQEFGGVSEGIPPVLLQFLEVQLVQALLVGVPEVTGDVAARAVEALLLAGPESRPDGPPRLDAEGLEDADRLHGHGAAGGVVHRPRPAGPGVEMPAEHDQLVLLIRAGDLGRDIVALGVLVIDRRPDLDLQRHRDLEVEDAADPVVLFGGDENAGALAAGREILPVPFIGIDPDRAEIGPVPARGLDQATDLFRHEELLELLPFQAALLSGLIRLDRLDGDGRFLDLPEALFVEPGGRGAEAGVDRPGFLEQDDRPLELAFVFFQVGLGREESQDGASRDPALGASRPRSRVGQDGHIGRGRHVGGDIFAGPAQAKLPDRLDDGVGQAELGEPLDRPGRPPCHRPATRGSGGRRRR